MNEIIQLVCIQPYKQYKGVYQGLTVAMKYYSTSVRRKERCLLFLQLTSTFLHHESLV